MLTNKVSNIIVAGMLGVMFLLLFFSAWNDSAIMDELAHIPAGYSYLTQKDMRLNPEHPPLIKDIAALPLLFFMPDFPTDQNYWTHDINGQWTAGSVFLYESGNNPDNILRFARFPVMLLAVFFGLLLFKWIRKKYGNKIALLTLFFFSFSPTFLAHSRYVTTDLAAAFGFFIGIFTFTKFLENNDLRSHYKKIMTSQVIIAGIAFGIAELLKFSLVLLAPLYIIYGLLWAFVVNFSQKNNSLIFAYAKIRERENRSKNFLKDWFKILAKTILIFLIGGALIYLVYLFHIWNYPLERQVHDTVSTLNSFSIKPLADLVVKMSGVNILRPLAEYLLGVLMVMQRAGGGNMAYFLGEVSAAGSHYYFPVAYVLKETLAFHILTLIAIFFGIRAVLKSRNKTLQSFCGWVKANFILVAGAIFAAIYILQSIASPLNIGVRHILPTFPFIYLLVARALIINKKRIIVFAGVLWIVASALTTFPYYLSYYNELAGGTKNGYKYITDSNYDWGQDLKRLKFFTDKNKIDKIYIDYFGGGSPKYYFGDKFVPWNGEKGILPNGSYLALSATFFKESTAKPARGFNRDETKTYYWLKNKEPYARAGTSIFIYKF